MITVAVSLTMESPMMMLENIIFGTTNIKNKTPIKTINKDVDKSVEKHVYNNIALEHDVHTGKTKMHLNFIDQSPEGTAAAINQPLDVSDAAFITEPINALAGVPHEYPSDSANVAFEREQATNL